MEKQIMNAEFEIIDMINTTSDRGFAWGVSDRAYGTWGFKMHKNGKIDFHSGHYFVIDPDAPARANAACRADYYARLADRFELFATYGF